ncbi:MAG: hypothetical protein ACP5SD_09920 [Elusimicrobiales bacterium]|nr:hypothetical protein [Elusimicrobiales bacterium]
MKNKDVIIITQNLEDTKRMETIFQLAGYKPFFCRNINEASDMLEKFVPLALIITESSDPPAEIYAKEIKKIAPLLPVIIAQKNKDFVKREEFRKIADEVIEFPWTEVELAKKLSLFESRKVVIEEKPAKKIKNLTPIILITTLIMIIPFSATLFNKKESDKPKDERIIVPTVNISGFFSHSGKTYIYDWLLQSFYIYDKDKLETIKNFPTSEIATIVKDGGEGFFFFITDNWEVKKRTKSGSYNIISSTKPAQAPKDICFDGMYVWMLTENNIIKSMNDDNLSQISRYNLPYDDIEYIGCDGYEIYYYSKSKIYASTTENPSVITKKLISPDKKILSFDYKGKKIRYIYQENSNSIYGEIKTYP